MTTEHHPYNRDAAEPPEPQFDTSRAEAWFGEATAAPAPDGPNPATAVPVAEGPVNVTAALPASDAPSVADGLPGVREMPDRVGFTGNDVASGGADDTVAIPAGGIPAGGIPADGIPADGIPAGGISAVCGALASTADSVDETVILRPVGADAEPPPVFVDATGRRSRRLRRLAYVLGALGLGYTVLVGVSVAGGASFPQILLPLPDQAERPLPLPMPTVDAGQPSVTPSATAVPVAPHDPDRNRPTGDTSRSPSAGVPPVGPRPGDPLPPATTTRPPADPTSDPTSEPTGEPTSDPSPAETASPADQPVAG